VSFEPAAAVKEPQQEEEIRQTPRTECGEGGTECTPKARPSPTEESVVCRSRVPPTDHRTKKDQPPGVYQDCVCL